MKTKSLVILGARLGALAALPGHSQTSSDAALDAQCRATEVTLPDSCPCTITKARQVGLNDTELTSLFKDDGHSDPVDEGKYGQFWQVKSKCIADTMMASLGVSQGNPLPGVPAHMRPQMPGAAPAPAPVTSPAPPPPPPPTALVTPPSVAMAPPPVSAASAASASGPNSFTIGSITPTRTLNTREDGEETVELKYTLQGGDYFLAYAKALEGYPGVLDRAFAMQSESLERAIKYDEPSSSSYRNEEHTFWGAATGIGRLSPILASGYTNNRPAGQFLYSALFDTELGREIQWSDVFGTRVWNGAMREHYCAGLQAERLEKDTWEYNTHCPDFEALAIEFKPQEDGSLKLSFAAYNGVAGSYAEGPYESQIPLTADLLSAVQPAYRDVFAGVRPSIEQPLITRPGRKLHPAPHYMDRDTANLDFDYSWNGAQVSSSSGLSWALRERALADFELMSARADAMIGEGTRKPVKFEALWTMSDPVGQRLVGVRFLEVRVDKNRPLLLPEREAETVFWDQTDNVEVTMQDIFPRDWNTTIRESFCATLTRMMESNSLTALPSCPSFDAVQTTFMQGMDGDHFLSFRLTGEGAGSQLGSFTIPITREMKARANAKYRNDLIVY